LTAQILHWFAANPTSIVAAVSAAFAIATYQRNARTKEAEFISQLHRDFFVEETYKKVRETIDLAPGTALEVIDQMVEAESAEFTDFLNFFELAAYFKSRGILSKEALEAILAYYLNLFEKNMKLRAYISSSANSYGYLNTYLTDRRKKR